MENSQRKYHKIYALEPDEENFRALVDNIAQHGLENVEPVQVGAWLEKTTLKFSSDANMATIAMEGDVTVPVDTVDNVLAGDAATYIKMDIEGAELEALKGAEQTIRTHLPLLAICVYHKPEDLIAIPQYIRSLSSDYEFYLRQHQYISWETVLYAIAKK